jgi:hypothetical protein
MKTFHEVWWKEIILTSGEIEFFSFKKRKQTSTMLNCFFYKENNLLKKLF